jgi:hypothetical protein
MIRRWLLLLVSLGLLAGGPARLAAQEGAACPAIVGTALDMAGEVCAGLGRNTACYGHDRVEAILRAEDGGLAFAAPADRVPLAALETLHTAALDESTEEWGVAVLHVQANLPDTLPGQAVTMLLMGDASLEDASTEDAAPGTATPPAESTPQATPAPMQAITFHSGLGGATCQEAAGSLLVQSPEGMEVALTINGLDVQLGSTALFSTVPAEDGEALVASLVEGHLRLLSEGRLLNLTESGAAVAITLNALGRVDAASRLLDPGPLLETAGQVLPGADACRAVAPLLRDNFDPADCGIAPRFDLLEGILNDGWQPGDLLPDHLQPGSILPDGLLPDGLSSNLPGNIRPRDTQAACFWPAITTTSISGDASQPIAFNAVPGAAYYMWFVEGETNGYRASGRADGTSFPLDVSPLPLGAWYRLWVVPYGADGAPLCQPANIPPAVRFPHGINAPPAENPPPAGNVSEPTRPPSDTNQGSDTLRTPLPTGTPASSLPTVRTPGLSGNDS